MTRSLTLFHGPAKVQIDYEPPRSRADVTRIVKRAEHKLRKSMVKGASVPAAAWTNLEQNLRRWVDKGFDGQLSVDRAFADPSGVDTRPTTTVIDVRSIGTEHELRGFQVAGPSVQYSARLAKTDETATVPVLVAGSAGSRRTKWPLMALTADQVHGTKGCIEVVFGPTDITDTAELARRGVVMGILQDSLRQNAGKKLEQACQAYNAKLDRLTGDDARLSAYRLGPANDIDLTLSKDSFNAVQTNIEVPLKKLGDTSDTTVPALFAGRNEADDKAMFIEARACASELVDALFLPTAAAVHGDAFEVQSIKLDKMRATFTLFLYCLAKTSQQGTKGAWPVLPKVGSGDLIRDAFSTRDKAVLFHHTSDSDRLNALSDALIGYAGRIKSKREFGRAIKPAEADKMRADISYLLEPGQLRRRWGKEQRSYGTVNWSDDSYSGTITGKPIRPGADYARRTLTKRRPKVVLEIRRESNPINAMIDHLASSPTVEGKDAYDLLAAATAAPSGVRPAKTEVTE